MPVLVWYDVVIVLALLISVAFYRSILLKVLLFISFYPTVVLLLYKSGFPMKGTLGLEYNFFPKNVKDFAFYSSCLAYASLFVFFLPLRKKHYEFKRLPLSPFIRMSLAMLYIVAIVLTFPRTFGINIGVASGSIGLVISVLIIASKTKKFDLPSIIHMFFLMIVIAFGERVDAILALLFHLLFDAKDGKIKEYYKTQVIYPAIIGIFVLGLVAETQRLKSKFTPEYVVQSVFTQHTAVDVCYIYLTGVYYYETKGTITSPVYNALFGLVPGEYSGIHSKYNYTQFLKKEVLDNPGGGLYYTEGVLVFGLYGMIIYPLVLSTLIKYFFRRTDLTGTLVFILLYIMQLRMQWYGLIYFYTPCLVLYVAGFWFESEIRQANILKRMKMRRLNKINEVKLI